MTTTAHDGEMIPQLTRHAVQVLLGAGHSVADVAQRTGLSRRSVTRIGLEAPVAQSDDHEAARARRVGRPSKVAALRSRVEAMLRDEPDMLALEVLRRLRLDGYAGGKTAVYELVAAVRPKPGTQPMVRFEGLAGEFCQHDFGQVDVRFVDGSKRRVRFFASRLKYSRWVQVKLVDDEQGETLLRAVVDHYHAMGGVPLLAVFDRPSTVVVRADRGDGLPELNPRLAALMLDLGVGVELCAPRSGNQKGSVENLVGWVKGSFFKCRRFLDEEDLVRQLDQWHSEVNEATPSRATGVTPSQRMIDERPRLRPLRVTPDTFALRHTAVVDAEAMVTFEAARYSMPPETIGRSATLFVFRDRVRVVVEAHCAVHPRLREAGARSVLPEHRKAMTQRIRGERGRLYYQREALRAMGANAERYLTELVHRDAAQMPAVVQALCEHWEARDAGAVLAVMVQALADGAYTADAVRALTGKGSGRAAEEVEPGAAGSIDDGARCGSSGGRATRGGGRTALRAGRGGR